MILHYSLPILKDNDNALSLLFFSNANTLVWILQKINERRVGQNVLSPNYPLCPLAPSCHPNTTGCCICERQKQQRHLSRGFRRWIQTFLATVNQTWATPPSFEHVLSQKVGKKLRYLELIKRILYQSIRTRGWCIESFLWCF